MEGSGTQIIVFNDFFFFSLSLLHFRELLISFHFFLLLSLLPPCDSRKIISHSTQLLASTSSSVLFYSSSVKAINFFCVFKDAWLSFSQFSIKKKRNTFFGMGIKVYRIKKWKSTHRETTQERGLREMKWNVSWVRDLTLSVSAAGLVCAHFLFFFTVENKKWKSKKRNHFSYKKSHNEKKLIFLSLRFLPSVLNDVSTTTDWKQSRFLAFRSKKASCCGKFLLFFIFWKWEFSLRTSNYFSFILICFFFK